MSAFTSITDESRALRCIGGIFAGHDLPMADAERAGQTLKASPQLDPDQKILISGATGASIERERGGLDAAFGKEVTA